MSFLFGTEVIFQICDKKGNWNVAVKLGLKTSLWCQMLTLVLLDHRESEMSLGEAPE